MSGTYCCVVGCSNCTGMKALSFFRFPKDPERANKWLHFCNRMDLANKANLSSGYRVCAAHFEKSMLENGLRVRLRKDAVPTIFCHDGSSFSEDMQHVVESASESIGANSMFAECLHVRLRQDAVPTILCHDGSLSEDKKHVIESSNESMGASTSSVATQTKKSLSYNIPRKEVTRKRLKNLSSKNLKYSKKMERMLFEELCDKFLNGTLSSFVKMQADLGRNELKGRRYTNDFKEFATTIYFLSPKCYHFLQSLFQLPTKRSLERFAHNFKCRGSLSQF